MLVSRVCDETMWEMNTMMQTADTDTLTGQGRCCSTHTWSAQDSQPKPKPTAENRHWNPSTVPMDSHGADRTHFRDVCENSWTSSSLAIGQRPHGAMTRLCNQLAGDKTEQLRWPAGHQAAWLVFVQKSCVSPLPTCLKVVKIFLVRNK